MKLKIILLFTFTFTFTFTFSIGQNLQHRPADSNSMYVAKVTVNGTEALIDIDGNYIVPPGIYEYINYDDFREGLCDVRKNGKYGFIDINGTEVIPCIWDMAWAFKRGLAVVGRNNNGDLLRGMIDRTGKIVIPCKYAFCYFVESKDDKLLDVVVCVHGQYDLWDVRGNELLKGVYSISNVCCNEMLRCSTGNVRFFIDKSGNIKSKYYAYADNFSNGFAKVEKFGGKCGYIDVDGEEHIIGKYQSCGTFQGQYAIVRNQNKEYGVINSSFEEIIPCMYDDIHRFRSKGPLFMDRFIASQNGKKGIIDQENNVIVPFGAYEGFWDIDENEKVIVAETGHQYSRENSNVTTVSRSMHILLDEEGNKLTDKEYEYIGDFYNGYAYVKLDDKYGLINSKGEEVIPCKYHFDGSISEFVDNGVVAIKNDDKYGLLSLSGEQIIPYEYDNIYSFNEGLAAVENKRKIGAIDTNGNIVIPTQWREPVAQYPRFHGGRLPVCEWSQETGWKYGYIGLDGDLVIPYKFDKVSAFISIE